MPKILVEVSPQQARVFEALANSAHAKPGEVVLAFASERIEVNGNTADPRSELMGLCWKYSKARCVPDASNWLSDAEMAGLGHDGPPVIAAA